MEQRISLPGSSRKLPLPVLGSSTPLPDNLPVSGGWGYTRESACIITDDIAPANDALAHGRRLAGELIAERLRRELDSMPVPLNPSRILWKTTRNKLIRAPDGSPAYDYYSVSINALITDELDVVQCEHAEVNESGELEHIRAAQEKWRSLRFQNEHDFWFDISRVKGIPDDADMTMMMFRGAFA